MAEKNVSELKDLLPKAVKAMEGLADTEEGYSKTERRTDSSSNQSSSCNYKTELERLFPNVYAKKRTSWTTTHTKFSIKKYHSSSLKKKRRIPSQGSLSVWRTIVRRMFQPFKRKGYFSSVV